MTDRRFARFAAMVLVYTIAVILWGALVRITGSGAGCGQHWPTCLGEVVPPAPAFETVIEFTHRLTSGLCFLLIVGLFVAASRSFEGAPGGGGLWRNTWRGHRARRWSALSVIFVVVESLLGAGLVLLEYVGDDDSYARGVWMAVHLANTFCLVGVVMLSGWFAVHPGPIRLRGRSGVSVLLGLAVAGVVFVSMTGAVAALGQTLFPAPEGMSVVEHMTQDPWADTRYPMIVRGVHPFLSVGVSAYLAWMALAISDRMPTPRVARATRALLVAVAAQVSAGVLNIALSAPGAMQLVHLTLANALWLTLLWVVLEVGATGDVSPEQDA